MGVPLSETEVPMTQSSQLSVFSHSKAVVPVTRFPPKWGLQLMWNQGFVSMFRSSSCVRLPLQGLDDRESWKFYTGKTGKKFCPNKKRVFHMGVYTSYEHNGEHSKHKHVHVHCLCASRVHVRPGHAFAIYYWIFISNIQQFGTAKLLHSTIWDCKNIAFVYFS